MSEPSWGKYGTWEEAESCIGQIIGESVGVDAVELGSIRRWLEPKEFDCGLHIDAEAAKAAGIYGAPSVTTEDGELFWGNDRIEVALDWAIGEGRIAS